MNRLLRFLFSWRDARMVEEFKRVFPGRCMICSYHDFGVRNFYVNGPVEPHVCIERERDE